MSAPVCRGGLRHVRGPLQDDRRVLLRGRGGEVEGHAYYSFNDDMLFSKQHNIFTYNDNTDNKYTSNNNHHYDNNNNNYNYNNNNNNNDFQ